MGRVCSVHLRRVIREVAKDRNNTWRKQRRGEWFRHDTEGSSRTPAELELFVGEVFAKEGIPVHQIEARRYPSEVIVVVEVSDHFDKAVALGNRLDPEIEDGFVVVRRATGNS